MSGRRTGGLSSCLVIEHFRDGGGGIPAVRALCLAEGSRSRQVVHRQQRDQLAAAVATGHDLRPQPAEALEHLVKRLVAGEGGRGILLHDLAIQIGEHARHRLLRQVDRVVADAGSARRERLVANGEDRVRLVDPHRRALHAELRQELLQELVDATAHASAPPVVNATAE